MTSAPKGRRSGGRAARKAARSAAAAEASPYLVRASPPYDPLSDEGLACIEDNAETILEEVGIDFRSRIGGVRAHTSGSGRRRTCAGRVRPSLRSMPSRSRARASSVGTPSTWAQ